MKLKLHNLSKIKFFYLCQVFYEKLLLSNCKIEIDLNKLDATENFITITMNENPKINIESLLQKIERNNSIKLVGENKIRFDVTSNNITDYKRNIEEVFLVYLIIL